MIGFDYERRVMDSEYRARLKSEHGKGIAQGLVLGVLFMLVMFVATT